jgi:transcriptional regulator with XRE-family HTH domain
MAGSRPPGTSLADRLNLLFENVHPADRGPWTNKEVAAAIRAGGGAISDVYVWQLRTGRRDNPSRQCLQELADFFDIDPAYFFDDRRADEILRDLHALRAMRRLGVRAVAARLGELAGHDPEALGEILDRVVHALQARESDTGDGSAQRG